MAGGSSPGAGSCAVAFGVRAFVRLRPPAEKQEIDIIEFSATRPRVITIKDPLSSGRREHSYEFSGVFDKDVTQEKVFAPVAGPVVDGALLGRSGCVMAYGQTGSGKTYSIFGEGNGDDRGLLPRAMERLFHGVAERERTLGTAAATITVSFLEVYMDQVRDLGFDPSPADESASEGEDVAEDEAGRRASRARTTSSGSLPEKPPGNRGSDADAARLPMKQRSATTALAFTAGKLAGSNAAGQYRPPRGLEVRETPDGTVHVQGLAKLPAKDLDEVRRILDMGQARRSTATTAVNVQSSRSHTVFTVYLPSLDKDESCISLSFVDLAGSERLAKSKAEGQRFHEALAINSSLTALGKVVLALASDPKTVKHIPYRDSKLTRILSPSLGGGTQVSLLATIHPQIEDYEESLNTLSFADRCKNVARQPQVSYISVQGNQKKTISDLQATVAELKDQLQRVQASSLGGDSGVGQSGLRKPLDSVDLAIAEALAGATLPGLSPDRKRASLMGTGGTLGASMGGIGANAATAQGQKGMSPDILALMQIQAERDRQAKNKEKYDERIKALGSQRSKADSTQSGRVAEVSELEARRAGLEKQLQEIQAVARDHAQAKAKSHGRDVEGMKDSLDGNDGTLFRIHQGLERGRLAAGRKQMELEERGQQLEEKRVGTVLQLKERHAVELEELKAEVRARLDAKEARNLKLAE
ncbi:unnamed protein product, partial [Polarella glacialis]